MDLTEDEKGLVACAIRHPEGFPVKAEYLADAHRLHERGWLDRDLIADQGRLEALGRRLHGVRARGPGRRGEGVDELIHRRCSVPRCPTYARPGSSMCDRHGREYERERSRRRRGGLKRGPSADVTDKRDADESYRYPSRREGRQT
jgi:hypothetical protein